MTDECKMGFDAWEWAAQETLGATGEYDVKRMCQLIEQAPEGAEESREYALMSGYLDGLAIAKTDIDRSLGAWLHAAQDARKRRQVHRLTALIQGAPRQLHMTPEYHALQGFSVGLQQTLGNPSY